MTNNQESHLLKIKQDFISLVDDKYRKGAEKHGGDLMSYTKLQLIDAAIEECIDQFVYLSSLRDKIAEEW